MADAATLDATADTTLANATPDVSTWTDQTQAADANTATATDWQNAAATQGNDAWAAQNEAEAIRNDPDTTAADPES